MKAYTNFNIKFGKYSARFIVTVVFVAIFLQNGYGQTIGDYRSASTGNWTALASWQRFDGASWVTPSLGQGYPGQNPGTGVVYIGSGHTITIGSAGITTQSFVKLSIAASAQLYLNGSNSQVVFSLNTPTIEIISGGSIYFANKVQLKLTTDAVVTLAIGANSIIGSCNNNDVINIGTVQFAACAGAPGDVFTFAQVMTMGGTLNAVPTSNSPLCQGSTINLTGSYSGAIGSTPTYSWSVTDPASNVTTYSTQNVNIPSSVTGTYSAKLTVTTVLAGTTYTNSETISVIVNPLPTLTGASQAKTVCDGSPATINLSGLVPSTTSTVSYNINNVAQTPVTGVVANGTGTAAFTTPSLYVANNGQTLQITGITITSSSTNCAQSFSQNVTLSVWTTGDGTWTGSTSSDWNTASNWCGGSVPSSSTDVYISPNSASVLNQPVIGTAGGICNNITINTGATLTISGSNTLSVYGDWTNSGTFTPNSGTVSFTGSTAAQTISGSGNTFNNLTINNTYSGGGVKAGSNIAVNGILNLSAANPSSTVGALEMVTNYNGYPGTTTTIPIVSYVLTMGSSATTTGQGDVTGKIYRSSVNANTSYTYGNQYTTYSFTVAPTDVTVIVTIGTAYGQSGFWGDPLSVKRSYEMIPTGGTGARVSMNLHYLESELNGNTESQLVTGDYDIGGGAPLGDEHGRSSYDFTNNYIGLSGIPISYFIYNASTHDWRTIFNLHNYHTGHTTWDGSESSSWMNDQNWSAGVPGEQMTAIIPDASTTPNDPVLAANDTIGGMQILSGGILDLDGQTITLKGYNYNGWEDQSGLSDYAGSTVVIDVNSTTPTPIPVSGVPHFNNLTINSSANVTVNLNSHIYISGTFTKTGTFDAGTFDNIVDYNGAAQTVVLPDGNNKYYNLILAGSGAKTLPASNMSVIGNFTLEGTASTSPTNALTIGNNLTLGSGTTFTAGSLTHNIAGNFINNGGTFTNTGSTINLNGTAAQSIGGSASTTFNNLTVNNASGVTIGIGETVNGVLNLTSGLITTGSYTLTGGCSGSITNASSSSYIAGKLARIYCTTGSKDFPVGKGGNFRQLTINYTALTGTSTVTAEQFESTISGTNPANATVQTGRYWTITESGGSSYSYDITLNGSPFTPGNGSAIILKGDGSSNSSLTATFSDPNFTATGVTSFSNFAVASDCPAPTITAQPSSTSSCAGSGTPSFTVTATVTSGTPTYQWEESTSGTGGTYSTITNGGVYSNATTSSLTITNPPYSMNGYAYRVLISRDCGSSIISDSVVLTVNDLPSITLGSNPSVCNGASTADLTYSATSGSPDQYRIDYDATAEAAGLTDVSYAASNLPSSPISLTIPSNPGTFDGILYVKNSSNSCESTGYPFSVIINILPQGSLSGNTICSDGTGQLTWTAESGTGPFTVVYNDGTADRTASNVYSGTAFNVYTNPSTTQSYTLVSVAGSYCTRTTGFTGGSGTVTVISDVVWLGTNSTSWDSTANWCGGVPLSSSNIVIASGTSYTLMVNKSLASPAVCNTLTVNSGATLIINAGKALTVNGNTTNNGSIMIFADASGMGSFIDNGSISGSGTCEVQRWVSTNASSRWEYVSSPVASASSSIFTSASHSLFYADETLNAYVAITNASPQTMGIMRGYTRKYVNSEGDGDEAKTFTGTINTASQSIGLTLTATAPGVNHGWNLVGNPYPSTMDWDASSGWTKTNIDNAIYFRTNGNYGSYVDGVGTSNGTQYIPPMQAFWVRVSIGQTTGTLACNNSVRVHNSHNIYKFIPDNTLHLTVTNDLNGLTDDTYVRFKPNATSGFDSQYDAYKMFAADTVYPQVYTNNGIDDISINSLSELVGEIAIPLGFKTSLTGPFTFTADGVSSFTGVGNSVYIEDLQTGEYQNLSTNNIYQFTSGAFSGLNRFILHFNPQFVSVPEGVMNDIRIFGYDNYINISSLNMLDGDITVYDVLGQIVATKHLSGTTSDMIKVELNTALYIVKYTSGSQTITRRVFLNK